METKVGLINNVTCQFKKIDPELIDRIHQRTSIEPEIIRNILRYNILTINQFAKLAKLSVSNVLNKTRASVVNGDVGTELDFCYPFSDDENDGPKFIFRNEKAEKYLKA